MVTTRTGELDERISTCAALASISPHVPLKTCSASPEEYDYTNRRRCSRIFSVGDR
ncbi:hypothetical protein E1B28_002055 [Marasmius oreades]|uniref:Uncharacterized protein n=1 Tax=Marasmius oreades TaxID=181124 RepID=A0A9P7V567_9AGAR|nr:uncharacterized protein E1B28_002055 [Marasmius oreades]KAG7100282.1 hypothetical protein E1B28_002055 [Marasmius oreades]